MYEDYLKKKKEDHLAAEEQPTNQEEVYNQIAWAAGTDVFKRRDPSYHLSEEFTRSFDAIGQRYAGNETGEKQSSDSFDHTDMSDKYVPRYGAEGQLKKFADISFKRGNLSAAIVNGTGKMMLFSCLKRTIGQEHSLQLRERKLFQMSSVHRELPASQNAMDVTNRGFADSAVGMVVDVLKDARQSLNNLEKIAHSQDQIDRFSGTDTMRKMYPFLFLDREQELLKSYTEKLKEKDLSEEDRKLFLDARKQVEAVIARKQQTSREFLQRLRVLRNRAEEAEKVFSSDTFFDELFRNSAAASADAADPNSNKGNGADSDTGISGGNAEIEADT